MRQTHAVLRGVRRASLLLTVVLAGCAGSASSDRALPTAPTGPTRPPAAPAVAPPTTATPERTGTAYEETTPIYASPGMLQYHGGILSSRYVFYDDGRFGLRFASGRFGQFEYGGSYVRSDSTYALTWDGWSAAGRWESNVRVHGDTLIVRYGPIMQTTDFIDGTYLRVR